MGVIRLGCSAHVDAQVFSQKVHGLGLSLDCFRQYYFRQYARQSSHEWGFTSTEGGDEVAEVLFLHNKSWFRYLHLVPKASTTLQSSRVARDNHVKVTHA